LELDRRADGTGNAELLYEGVSIWDIAWSPDGESLLMQDFIDGDSDMLRLRPGTDSVATPLIATEQFLEAGASVSNDGRWVAYSSNQTERHEIFVRTFPDVDGGVWQVSTEGGVQPVWAHNGRELFFLGLTADSWRRSSRRSRAHSVAGESPPSSRHRLCD
jgi:Tol biopolymer transport system component